MTILNNHHPLVHQTTLQSICSQRQRLDKPLKINLARVIKTRDTRSSNMSTLGRVLSNVDWSCLNNFDSCEEKLKFFNTMILHDDTMTRKM